MESWKHIFTLKKRAIELIGLEANIKEKQEYLNKIKEILDKYSVSMKFPRLLGDNISNKTELTTLKNLYYYLSCDTHPEGFSLNSPTDILNWHKDFLKLRINSLNNSIEVNGWSPKLTDNTDDDKIMTSIIAQLKAQKSESKFGKTKTIQYDVDSYFKSGVIEHFNPIKEYFDRLDRDTDRSEIDKVIKLVNESALNTPGKFFADWCLGLIKNGLGDNYYDRILYLHSAKGGDGKTYFIQYDLIPALKEYITTDFSFNVDSKDDKFKLTENIIAIDDEGTSTSRRSDDAKKSISSKAKVSERQAYAKQKVSLKRISSFVVCLNTDEISSASNYDRRSLVVSLPSTGWREPNSLIQRWRREVNIDKFWAQLYSIWRADKEYNFVTDEEILIESNNWKQTNEDTDLIDMYVRKPRPNEKYVILSHVKIKTLIETRSGKPIKRSINGYLKTKGFEPVRMKKCPSTGKFTTGYCVIIESNDVYFSSDQDFDSLFSLEEKGDEILDRIKYGIEPNEKELEILKKLGKQ